MREVRTPSSSVSVGSPWGTMGCSGTGRVGGEGGGKADSGVLHPHFFWKTLFFLVLEKQSRYKTLPNIKVSAFKTRGFRNTYLSATGSFIPPIFNSLPYIVHERFY